MRGYFFAYFLEIDMALRNALIAQPHLYITDTNGRPLDGGKVYFGQVDKDPELYPIDIFYDDTLTTAAAQPVRTKNGFMNASGNNVLVYAIEEVYSLKVVDAYGRQVYYIPSLDTTNAELDATNAELDKIKFDTGITVTPYDVNGVSRNLHEKLGDAISIKDFGAKGDGVTDDTQALRAAIAACSNLGTLRKVLNIPNGIYVITEMITIDDYISFVGESNATNSWLHVSPQLKFTNSSGFDFSKTADYCNFKNLYISGTKTGVVDLPNNVFGNFGMRFSQGAAGIYENLRVQGFDCGRVSYLRAGDEYAGAYRYFNYCKFNLNTYNIVQQGHTTDDNFFQCDFRKGLIAIGFDTVNTGYQSATYVDCMFEAMNGMTSVTDYEKSGVVIKGNSHVKIIGGYSENCTFFVDKEASLHSSAYIVGTSEAVRHAGGGIINIDNCFARASVLGLPDLDLEATWRYVGFLKPAVSNKGDLDAYRFTVTDVTERPYLTLSDFSKLAKINMDSIPANYNKLFVQVTVEYAAPVGKSVIVDFGSAGVPSGTFTDPTYYDSTTEWRRKSDVIPIYTRSTQTRKYKLSPYIRLLNAEVGDVFYIRRVEVKFLSY